MDWKILGEPDHLIEVPLQCGYSVQEYEEMTLGIHPMAMEDKWFIYSENSWIYFHRSWTGAFYGKVRLEKQGTEYTIAEAWIAPGKNQKRDEKGDTKILEYLIDGLLLDRDVSLFPKESIINHVYFGWNRSRRELDAERVCKDSINGKTKKKDR